MKRVDRLTIDAINTAFEANLSGLLKSGTPVEANAVNGTFVVAHDLNEKPYSFIYEATDSVTVRATKANRDAWGAKTMALTGSAAGRVTIIPLKRL